MARIRDTQKTEQIYQATLELVLKQGFSGLKMADVAAQAGLATGTVYIYFKDKDELINQLYAYLKQKGVDAYSGGLDDEDSFKKSLRRLWKQFFNYNLERSAEVAFLEQYFRSPFLKSNSKKEGNTFFQPFLSLLERGQDEKKLIKMEKQIILAMLVGPVHEMVRMQQSGSLKISPAVIDTTFDQIWEGIKR